MEAVNAKKHIRVIGTGGTIASAGASVLDFHQYNVSSTIQEILSAVPEATEIAELSSSQPVNIDSYKIDNPSLVAIGRSAVEAATDDSVDGIVITHGTDTLEETAYFLHLVLPTDKPVVVVGAMRPSTGLSADGPLNLYHAILTASSSSAVGKGVLVVVNGQLYSARDVVKRDTASVGAIDGGKYGIIGEISGGNVCFSHAPVARHTLHSEFSQNRLTDLPTVDILFDHQGAGSHLYEASVTAGAQGIIVAGMGNGSLSPGARSGAMLAHAAGIPFIRSSRTGQGIVAPLRSDQEYGIISAHSLPPHKARILAMLAIAGGISGSALQKVFSTY
ncbi:L-asparaginase [Paenarthrobacter ureafaciens]|uniref:asparaginase n=1 Tax=Paenarthrobacter ureafaciens TaxID=37931 RepID=UPI0015BE2343|nr:asparaginase [Paenarthrobacter ureafaciens]NWL27151.1 L-asparaginase [Paenarthrobacter ureafaciens]